MNQFCFQTPAWYHAITLAERLASRRPTQCTTVNAEVNAELAQGRLQRWRSQPPFSSDASFAQRLALDGVTEDGWLSLLGEPIEAVHDRFPTPPDWLEELAQAFARPFSSDLQMKLPAALRGNQMVGFLDAIEPLIGQACDRVHAGVQALVATRCDLPFDPSTVAALLFASVPGPLLAMLSRTMVLELHVARLQGRLQGDTPAARFQSFLQRMHQRDTVLALLQEYPVLARQLWQCLDRWVCVSLEFLHRLCADWKALQATFNQGHDPGPLVKTDSGVGDTHRGGRSVRIATFSSGFQVVYKPKSFGVDAHFQELLTWLNARGDHPPFRTLTLLDRGTYGWVEFVAAKGCSTVDEVRRFYERQGGYLALLYALEATDFHFENLIAAGEHPVLIDLEALFQPRVGGMDLTQADGLAWHTMAYSVLRVGLLPQRLWANAENEGIDISGLGTVEGQLTPYGVPYWEEAGTDTMHLARQRRVMSGGQNRPMLDGAEVNALDYAEAIEAGFTAVYRSLLRHRGALLADDGPLACFAEDEVRAILRATRTYALLLRESFHPDMLRDALERDRLFDRLWAAIEYRPYLAGVIAAERDDLQQGDIPMFTTRPGVAELRSSRNEPIADFFDEPGLVQVRRRIQQLCEADLTQQRWFIRASLTALSLHGAQWPTYHLIEPQMVATRERLLAAACAVGDRLETLALRGEHDVSWIGLTLTRDRYWSLAPLGTDLYGGLPGVALFLAYLGAITHEVRYTTLAQAAITTLRRQMERAQSLLTSIGGFDGWGGVIYVLTNLGMLWDQPGLLTEAETMVERLPKLIACDEQLDVIAGAAGCIGSLLSLYRCTTSEQTLAAAIQCGDRLIARAQSMERGISWSTAITPQALTGFSHGAAGMAWALLELSAQTGAARFRTAALEAIAYERSLFMPETGNWPDLRKHEAASGVGKEGQRAFMTAWCHGAPGIGLARLRALPHLDDPIIHMEIDTALKTTLAEGFGRNHSLCHGDLGNLELFVQASERLEAPLWRAQAHRLAAIILESIQRHGWLCGAPLGVESPGLMTGLAGIGYELLRLAEPQHVPAVLVLAPPLHHSSR